MKLKKENAEKVVPVVAEKKSYVWEDDSTGSGSASFRSEEDGGAPKRLKQLQETRNVPREEEDERAAVYAKDEKRMVKQASV